MSLLRPSRFCRICQGSSTGLLKYATRAYAHASCLLRKHGPDATYAMLPLAELEHFPIFQAAEFGGIGKLRAAIKARKRSNRQAEWQKNLPVTK